MDARTNAALDRMRTAKAEQALDALRGYAGFDPDDLGTTLVDFLSDAMHLAEQREMDFDALLGSAERHFHAEGGDGEDPDDIAEATALERWG